MGFFNILSRGNYYINSLFFNFFCFLGHIALYRVFKSVYPKATLPLIIGCFLLPSLLYFSSGIHKDLIIFTALAVFCYCMYFSRERGFSTKRVVFLILSFIAVLLMRNFIAVILFPCAIAWFISRRYRIKPIWVFSLLLLTMVTGTLLLHFTSVKYDPLQVVAAKQQAFLSLGKAATDYHNDTLQPTVKSFITSAPTALRHAFFSPYPGEFSNHYINLFSAEPVIFFVLCILMFVFPSRTINISKEFIVFGIVFTFLVLLFTGYISTTAGALIRYRSIYLPFLVIPMLCNINWSKWKGKTNTSQTY